MYVYNSTVIYNMLNTPTNSLIILHAKIYYNKHINRKSKHIYTYTYIHLYINKSVEQMC